MRAQSLARWPLDNLIAPHILCSIWQRAVAALASAPALQSSSGRSNARTALHNASFYTTTSSSSKPASNTGSSTNRGSDNSSSSSRDEASILCGSSSSSSSSSSEADSAETSGPQPLLGSQRFYKTVQLERSTGQGGWQLLLDKYPVKTPARNTVVLPTYPLALALAAEWEWLPKGKPILHAMPLMSLVATAIDQPKQRARVVDDLLKYVHTDASCVRYEPGPLASRQAKVFDPLLSWAREELKWHMVASDAICGPTQEASTVAAVKQWLEGLDAWHLAAVEQLTSACKSVVVAAALLHGRITPQEAMDASRLEESFQIEDWGMVEAGHDLDIADITTRVSAPALMVRLLEMGGGPQG